MRHSVFLLIAVLTLCAACATQTTIANNLPEREANEIVVLLTSRGIQAEKVQAVSGIGATGEPKWDINVNSSQITDALSVLNQSGLPRVKGTSLLDLFGSQGLVPSELQDRIRYQEGLSEQLATTIRKMDGIIDANVQITFPHDDDEEHKILTASVYIKHRGILDNPNSLTITKIKRLISSAIPGLTPENVSVVTDRALYADISLEPMQQLEEQRYFVSIWSLILAKESIARFRLIFYAFILLIFLLISIFAWIVWKCWPLIKERGGIGMIFKPQQYQLEEETQLSEKEKEKEGEGGEP